MENRLAMSSVIPGQNLVSLYLNRVSVVISVVLSKLLFETWYATISNCSASLMICKGLAWSNIALHMFSFVFPLFRCLQRYGFISESNSDCSRICRKRGVHNSCSDVRGT